MSSALETLRPGLRAAVDLLYSPSCTLCSRRLHIAEDRVCDPCRNEIVTDWTWRCPLCGATGTGHPPPRGTSCLRCPEPGAPFSGRLAATQYGPRSSECVRQFKYMRQQDIGRLMADIMVARLAEPVRCLEGRVGWVVPVPLHWSRRMTRGFNQADMLAQALARAVDLPFRPRVLRRTRRTKKQSLLPANPPERRMANVAGAFAVAHTSDSPLPGILLVDDVITSGNTVRECARVLAAAGAGQVWIATFAQA